MVSVKQKQEQLTIIPKDFMSNNPIKHLNTKIRELDNGVKGWLAKQSLPVETAFVTVSNATQGALIGGLLGSFNINTDAASVTVNPQAFAVGPLIQACNFAVMTGVGAGLHCVMKRLTGKEDIQTSMVAAFGSGVMFSLVSGPGGPNPAANVFTSAFSLRFLVVDSTSALQDVRIPPGPRLLIIDHVQKTKVKRGWY